jgi:hypothetical protein
MQKPIGMPLLDQFSVNLLQLFGCDAGVDSEDFVILADRFHGFPLRAE